MLPEILAVLPALSAIPPAVWWAIGALGSAAAAGSIWDKIGLEPKRLKLKEMELKGLLESQKAQTAGQRRAYETETRASQEYLRSLMAMRREELTTAALDRQSQRTADSRDRQLEMLLSIMGAGMAQPSPRRMYDPPPMSLMGLIRG